MDEGVNAEAIVDIYAYLTDWIETRNINTREYCAIKENLTTK